MMITTLTSDTNNRVPTQTPNTQYGHQKITERKVALDSSTRSNFLFHLVRLSCFSYNRSTKVVFFVTMVFTDICALLRNTQQVFIIRLWSRKYVSRPIILVLFISILYYSPYSHLPYDLHKMENYHVQILKYFEPLNLSS